jgi:hypothetical protein
MASSGEPLPKLSVAFWYAYQPSATKMATTPSVTSRRAARTRAP